MFIVLCSCLLYLLMVIQSHVIIIYIYPDLGSKGGAVVRARASHQCGPGSIPGVDAICVLSLLLVLSLAPRGFSSGYSGFPLSLKTNTFKFQFDPGTHRHVSTSCYELLSARWVNKLQYTIYNIEMKYTKNFE